MIAPSARLTTGHEAPRKNGVTGSTPRSCSAAAVPATRTAQAATQPHQAGHPGTSSATLEPVTVPAGARAAHPPPDTPARDRPRRAGHPTFRGNLTPSRPKDLQARGHWFDPSCAHEKDQVRNEIRVYPHRSQDRLTVI